MATQRLTERRIEAFEHDPAGSTRQVEWDTDLPGFGVRLYSSGKKSYVLQYRIDGRRRVMVIGPVGHLTLDQARRKAREERAKVNENVDPLVERERAREARTEARDVDQLIELFLEEHESGWSVSYASDTRRRLRGRVSHAIGRRKLDDVVRADVNRLHSAITKEGSPVEANRVRTIVHRLFEWAEDFGYLPEGHPNPARVRRGSKTGRNREGSRERFLTREEAARLIAAADSVPGGGTAEWSVGLPVRLWLLTGLRRSELLHRRWGDVDWKVKTLTVRNTKNGTTHVVPLSNLAVELLQNVKPDIAPPEGPIFLGRGGKAVSDLKKPWREARSLADLEDVTIHDLRRTVATWLTNLAGVPVGTVAALLNHKVPGAGVTAIYTRPMEEAVRAAVSELEQLIIASSAEALSQSVRG